MIFRPAGKPSKTILVTFTYLDFPDLSLPGLGEEVIAAEGCDQIIFKNTTADWYQSLPEATLDMVAVILRNGSYTRRVGYGISMGGYAAMAFAQIFGLTEIAVIAPQVSLDPEMAPGWDSYRKAISWRWPISKGGLTGVERIRYAYDPIAVPERRQFEGLKAMYPVERIDEVPVPFSDHQTAKVMGQEGHLKAFLLSACQGTPAPQRRHRLPPRREAASLVLIGQELEKRGRTQGATRAFRQACRKDTASAAGWAGWLRGLQRSEQAEEAVTVARLALGHHARDRRVLDAAARVYLSSGDLKAARDCAETLMEVAPKSAAAHLLMAQVFYGAGELRAARHRLDIVMIAGKNRPSIQRRAQALMDRMVARAPSLRAMD